jgi:hypothetical protein
MGKARMENSSSRFETLESVISKRSSAGNISKRPVNLECLHLLKSITYLYSLKEGYGGGKRVEKNLNLSIFDKRRSKIKFSGM